MAADAGQDSLRATYTVESIRARFETATHHSYLRDFVYGGIDGAVTTFAVVSGVAGAELSPGIVVVPGLASLIDDEFGMRVHPLIGRQYKAGGLSRRRASCC